MCSHSSVDVINVYVYLGEIPEIREEGFGRTSVWAYSISMGPQRLYVRGMRHCFVCVYAVCLFSLYVCVTGRT